MLEHVLTVMLVTPSQRYEKKTGRSKSDLLTYCARTLPLFALFGVVSHQRPCTISCRTEDKQGSESQEQGEGTRKWPRERRTQVALQELFCVRVEWTLVAERLLLDTSGGERCLRA